MTTSTHEQEFIQAINSGDDAARLAFSDWLREQGRDSEADGVLESEHVFFWAGRLHTELISGMEFVKGVDHPVICINLDGHAILPEGVSDHWNDDLEEIEGYVDSEGDFRTVTPYVEINMIINDKKDWSRQLVEYAASLDGFTSEAKEWAAEYVIAEILDQYDWE